MNTTELAQALSLSKARISQYVSEGKLAGCYQGEGRNRRFDLAAVQVALKKALHPGQMLGNGAETRQALKTLTAAHPVSAAPAPPRTDRLLAENDLDRYELAKIQSAEEDARRKRRENERDEGRWVLADEVQRQSAAILARELSQVEVMLREAARAVADRMGVDYRSTRKVLMDEWREYRSRRAAILGDTAADAEMTDAERAEERGQDG